MKIETIYKRPALRVLLHVLFWLAFTGISLYVVQISFSSYKNVPNVNQLFFAGLIRLLVFYYPFVYWVWPKFFARKRYIIGSILTILMIIFYAYTDALVENWLIKPCEPCLAVIDVDGQYRAFLNQNVPNRVMMKTLSLGVPVNLLFNICVPLTIKMALQAFRNQIRALQLVKENLQLEFNFLRSQVNPHFLFNTLNNIYGLILKDEKEKSAHTVARLSDFLRYSLYESNSEKVPVEKEIQLLKDYVDLESLRLNHIKVEVKHHNDGSVKTMAPLLLMPLIENSFKHTKDEPGAFITIDLLIIEKKIYFSIVNSSPEQGVNPGGIGLNNVRKRLQLYYPKGHTFTVKTIQQQFEVAINIDAHE